MHILKSPLLILTIAQVVDLNPLGLNSRVNNFREFNSGKWTNSFRPVELRPSAWDAISSEIYPTSRSVVDLYRTTRGPSLSQFREATIAAITATRGFSGSEFKPFLRMNAPVELLPARLDQGITLPTTPTTTTPTKAPEIDSWSFNIRLRPKSDHQIGPPNSTIFVHGEGFTTHLDIKDFTHPSFNPLAFLQRTVTKSPQPLKLQVVRDQPYFVFFAPDSHMGSHRLFKRSIKRRVKRHHPTILQNVLGDLQNYALVPIRSSNGKTSYILLKNPKFVIGASVLAPTPAAAQRPAVIQIAPQAAQTSPKVVYNPGIILPAPRTTYQSTIIPVRQQVGSHSIQVVANPVPTATSVDYHLIGQPDTRTHTHTNTPHAHVHTHTRPRVRQGNVNIFGGRLGSPRGFMQPQRPPPVVEPVPALGILPVRNTVLPTAPSVQKTEVVETVVETQNQQAAAVASDVTATGTASQTAAIGTDVGGAGAITQTGAVATAAQTSSAGTASEVKQAKKVVTKKTTTTKIQGDGVGGAVKEVSQVVEQSVHNNAAVATAETAAASSAVSSGSSAVVSDVLPAAAVAAENTAAVASSSSAASAANSSVKSVKTIKKTTVTKTKLADPNAAVVELAPAPTAILSDKTSQQAAPMPAAILSDTSNQHSTPAPTKKAKTAILSENNDRKAVNKQAALIPTQAPRRAARINRRRKRPRGRKRKRPTTTAAPTTAEMEMEMEEMSTTTAGGIYYTVTPTAPYAYNRQYKPTNPPRGVAGWAGPTTEPALGPLDRINTTDVPEEIEPLPDKTPAEKRRELRKLARERARKAGKKLVNKPQPNTNNTNSKQNKPPAIRQNKRQKKKPGPTTALPTTPPTVTEAVRRARQRQPPPRQQRRRQNRRRNRNRGTTRGPNNRANGRKREPEERRPVFRDPLSNWIYNNLETEMLEKLMPLFMFG